MSGFWIRLRACFQKGRTERDMDDELRFHLERQIEENVSRGMNPKEARYAALRCFGGIDQTKETCRETRGIRIVDELRQDLRYALRMLIKSPGFAIVAVLILALGIGATTAVVSIIDNVVFRALPVWEPDRLAGINSPTSFPDYLDFRGDDQVFSAVAAFGGTPLELENDQHPDGFSGRCVSANFFQVLGLKMAIGRSFLPEEDPIPGSHSVAVISYRLWERDFAADPAIVGKTLLANGEVLTIVGVAPKGFRDMSYAGAYRDVWIPISIFHRVQHLDKDPIWHDVLEARDKRWLGYSAQLN